MDWVEAVGNLHFPLKADRRLVELMDRNNEGLLQESERKELEALVELSEPTSLGRGIAESRQAAVMTLSRDLSRTH